MTAKTIDGITVQMTSRRVSCGKKCAVLFLSYLYLKENPKISALTTKKTKSKSTVNKAGNYTKPTLRKRIFERVKAGTKGGKAGQWSARKAQLLAKEYKAAGGGYK